MSVADLKKKLYFVVARYFRGCATVVLWRWRPRIIAVTGSAGKTTMMDMLEHEVGEKAHYSHDANSAFGVPFDVLGMAGIRGSKWRWLWLGMAAPVKMLTVQHPERLYVVEIDGERPHEAEFLAEWLKPEVTIWVSVGLSHAVQFEKAVAAGKFHDVGEAITAEFAELPKHTTRRVYIDGESKPMIEAVKGVAAKVVALKKSSIRKYVVWPDHTDFTYGDTTFHFAQPEPREVAYNLLVLQDLMKYLGLPFSADFSEMPVAPGRSSYFAGVKGVKIVDSSYNAHMISMASVLDMARRMHAERKWLVIGDIVDQGALEEAEHQRLASLITDVEPEMVVLVGRRTKQYTAPRLKELGVSAVSTTDPRRALKFIEGHITGKETLIFKGSQYLEWIIEKLLANPEDAARLCRREKAAVRRREKWGLR